MMSARECRGKVLLELFQKLTVSRGRASCRTPQSAKSLKLAIAQEGRKTVRWTVFRWEPSPGGPSAKHKMIKVSNMIPPTFREEGKISSYNKKVSATLVFRATPTLFSV